MRPAGRGEKNNEWVRIRNRRYKIKRILAQPRNIDDVRHNGRAVRRMVVTRSTIYPSARRRPEYWLQDHIETLNIYIWNLINFWKYFYKLSKHFVRVHHPVYCSLNSVYL